MVETNSGSGEMQKERCKNGDSHKNIKYMTDKEKRIQFVKNQKYLIISVINFGYECFQAIDLQKLIHENFHCALKTSRRKLFAPFIEIYAEIERPGYILVGSRQLINDSQAKEMPVILNPEDIIDTDLRAKRVLEFVGLGRNIKK